MSNECLACGSKEVDPRMIIYLLIPGTILPGGGTSYLLCEKHKDVRYDFSDLYEEDGTRKNVNHEEVINRSNKR